MTTRLNLAYHIVSGHSLKKTYLLCSLNLIYYGYRNSTWKKTIYTHGHINKVFIERPDRHSPVRRDEIY